MKNPWEEIDLKDYESHMSLESVYQLQVLNEIMREQFNSYDARTMMVLGVAGGNGIEHISAEKVDKVYGVDVNEQFLAECRRRYAEYSGVFETICANLLSEDLYLPCAEFVIANLLIEYIGYECFQRVVNLVKPKYVSCVIQINTGNAFVSDSLYLHAFDGLDEVHHQMEEAELVVHMQKIGYELEVKNERELPNGKKLVKMDFVNNKEIVLEKMGDFFDARLEGYDEHQLTCIESAREFYSFTARSLPSKKGAHILDLGCGTGLELEEYFKYNPSAKVTGIDLAPGMLAVLKNKFSEYQVFPILGSYFDVDFGKKKYDAVVSVESLHHFTQEEKVPLYRKVHVALQSGGYFILTDYFAMSNEQEQLHRRELLRLKKEQGIVGDEFYHYDTPLTVEHEVEALQMGGFSSVEVLQHWGATYTIRAMG